MRKKKEGRKERRKLRERERETSAHSTSYNWQRQTLARKRNGVILDFFPADKVSAAIYRTLFGKSWEDGHRILGKPCVLAPMC